MKWKTYLPADSLERFRPILAGRKGGACGAREGKNDGP